VAFVVSCAFPVRCTLDAHKKIISPTPTSLKTQQAALHAGKVYVATKAYTSDCNAAGGCRPAIQLSSWTLLQLDVASSTSSLNPSAFGPSTILQDSTTALAFPAVAVGQSGRPVVGYSFSAAAGNPVSGSGYPGAC